jgi:glyoxylate reductase
MPARVVQFGHFPAGAEAWEAVARLSPIIAQYPSAENFLARVERLPEAEGLLCTLVDRISVDVLDRMPNLKVIANFGVGIDHIALDEARRRGIVVTNTPNILGNAVADLTWALLLAAARRIVESDRYTREGHFAGWGSTLHLGMELTGKTLGIVGLGDIGKRVAQRAKGFEMTVLYNNRNPLPPEEEQRLGVSYRSFDALVETSDIISIHLPLTPETLHRFSRDVLFSMKPGSLLVSTGRGAVIDEAALVDALKEGPLFAAGLDVFEQEPAIHPELLELNNAVVTAHIGSATETTRRRMGDCVLANLSAVLQGHPALTPV